MKKLITTAAFIVFGTIITSAQTTQKKDTKIKMAEKPANSTEMKLKTPVESNSMNRTVDTANIEQRQKEADKKLQRQTIPQKDGLNNEAVKSAQPQPTPGQLE